MRYIPNTIAATATVTALVLSGTAAMGVAQAQPAQPAALYAPSALVLTVGMGEESATATVERAVTLNCTPRANGTHPTPAAACTELRSVDGEFAELTESTSQKMCTREWNPVVITATGVWQGKHVTWSATYPNACEMRGSLAEGAVFPF
ncbi:protease inhibitor protein [Streptomyces lunaelactis]|uniref:subtilase-type protease inhibitor n=1 Tax=Streptomyces lunaelactis TaxID=1535768 RepID=UPI001585CEBB|nr:subtilase-type protease inhibitor [Streptomyces lunaelactis]NUK95005.1 protease inhibitor protein [Streptomyces lunaelactis]